MTFDWGDVPNWVAAVAATIAAVAAVATWRRLRPAVEWQARQVSKSRYEITNVGGRSARDVRLRVGSESDPADSDPQMEERRERRTTGPDEWSGPVLSGFMELPLRCIPAWWVSFRLTSSGEPGPSFGSPRFGSPSS